MGETTSGWNVPLHSSDSEHEWSKRYRSKGKGGAFRLDRGSRSFPLTPGEAAGPGSNASDTLTNPFHKP